MFTIWSCGCCCIQSVKGAFLSGLHFPAPAPQSTAARLQRHYTLEKYVNMGNIRHRCITTDHNRSTLSFKWSKRKSLTDPIMSTWSISGSLNSTLNDKQFLCRPGPELIEINSRSPYAESFLMSNDRWRETCLEYTNGKATQNRTPARHLSQTITRHCHYWHWATLIVVIVRYCKCGICGICWAQFVYLCLIKSWVAKELWC